MQELSQKVFIISTFFSLCVDNCAEQFITYAYLYSNHRILHIVYLVSTECIYVAEIEVYEISVRNILWISFFFP